MLINIALIVIVFAATKRKVSPYWAAVLLGGIKGAIYATFTKDFILAAIMSVIFFLLAAGIVYFLSRLDRHDAKERPDVPSYSTTSTNAMKLRWEYVPLAVLMLLIIGGEMLLR